MDTELQTTTGLEEAHDIHTDDLNKKMSDNNDPNDKPIETIFWGKFKTKEEFSYTAKIIIENVGNTPRNYIGKCELHIVATEMLLSPCRCCVQIFERVIEKGLIKPPEKRDIASLMTRDCWLCAPQEKVFSIDTYSDDREMFVNIPTTYDIFHAERDTRTLPPPKYKNNISGGSRFRSLTMPLITRLPSQQSRIFLIRSGVRRPEKVLFMNKPRCFILSPFGI